ncbi:uncharacterized protein LOC135397488 [Ornithodoros turicata]|uniref:uncharacterized protein LOC135397488 n=1 Tax=Ornithodoros turicata TaxID=34597 RepID=UPI00313A3F16
MSADATSMAAAGRTDSDPTGICTSASRATCPTARESITSTRAYYRQQEGCFLDEIFPTISREPSLPISRAAPHNCCNGRYHKTFSRSNSRRCRNPEQAPNQLCSCASGPKCSTQSSFSTGVSIHSFGTVSGPKTAHLIPLIQFDSHSAPGETNMIAFVSGAILSILVVILVYLIFKYTSQGTSDIPKVPVLHKRSDEYEDLPIVEKSSKITITTQTTGNYLESTQGTFNMSSDSSSMTSSA